ncbi:hypothetical protein BKA64DRAFT_264522 [Cadophora sp. MPI-SDFR-AT-0126]|nr:hypothetical protein BKA64DRAFT_264522 [Leotiomycetes sp. MPI-SDFR-AT-0126]
MSAPPVAGWWTCRECGDWNSPYVAPRRCGGCNAAQLVQNETSTSSELPIHGPPSRVDVDAARENQHTGVTGDVSITRHVGGEYANSGSLQEPATHLTASVEEDLKLWKSFLDIPQDSMDNMPAASNQTAPLHHQHEITALSRSSSVISFADTTFSSIVSGSSQSSVGVSQAHTEQFSKLVFEDEILQPTCFAIVGVISLERFERKLRRCLRSFSAELFQEAKNIRERQAAKFVKLRSRNAAHLICDELNATRKLFKEKQNAVPQAWEQSSDSNFSEEEDGTADMKDLGSFILHSNAFENLRSELSLLLTQQLLEPLPFPGLDSMTMVQEMYEERLSQNVESRTSSWPLSTIKRRWYHTPKLEHGIKRVHWKCGCGSSIVDIYEELKPGAAKDFERQLRKLQRTGRKQRGGLAEKGRAIVRYFSSLPAMLSMLAATFWARQPQLAETGLPSFETRQRPENPSIPTPTITDTKLFVLLCVNNSIGSSRIGLKQPTVHDIVSDRQLFSLLHEKYFGSRNKWWTFLSLWSLRDIFFVHFEMYSESHVDIRERNAVPSADHEYLHEKCMLKPPVGSNTLKHFVECPASALTQPPCLKRIPKRMRNALTACPEKGLSPGWGLEFAEGWDMKKILTLTYFSFLAGCILALTLCLWKKYSVQDSVAIATLVFTIYAGGVAVFQASKNMT